MFALFVRDYDDLSQIIPSFQSVLIILLLIVIIVTSIIIFNHIKTITLQRQKIAQSIPINGTIYIKAKDLHQLPVNFVRFIVYAVEQLLLDIDIYSKVDIADVQNEISNAEFLIYVHDKKPVAMFRYFMAVNSPELIRRLHRHKLKNVMFITSLYVDPSYRRRGIAKKLIKKILHNNVVYGLEVLKNNAPAIALYNKLGFVIIGESHKHTAFIMSRITSA